MVRVFSSTDHVQLRGGVGVCQLFHGRAFVIITFAVWLRAHQGEKGLLWKVMLASLFLAYTTFSRRSASA